MLENPKYGGETDLRSLGGVNMEIKTEVSEAEITFTLSNENIRDDSRLRFMDAGDTIFVDSRDICDCNEYDLQKEAVIKLRGFLNTWLQKNQRNIVEAGYEYWNKPREKIKPDVLVGGTIQKIVGGNDFIVSNNEKYYEINVDDMAGYIDIVDITKLQEM